MASVYVSVDGVDYATGRLGESLKILDSSLRISDIVDHTPNTCQFTAMGFTPTEGKRVIVTHNSVRLFAGSILRRTDAYLGGKPANHVAYCSCIDDTWLLNKRKVIKRYTAQSATTIAQDIISTYCSGFTSTNVAASLATIDEITFTNEDVTDALTRLAKRIGGYWYLDYFADLHFFLAETGSNPVDLTSAHTSLSGFEVTTDLGQIVTRVYCEGGGSSVPSAVAVGDTILPVDDASWYEPAPGGVVVVGAQRLTYADRSLGGAGTLVGPGVSPASAPVAALEAGSAGVESGAHNYAATFVTAAGESLPSPVATVTTGDLAAPSTTPTAGTPTSGSGVTDGSHDYKVTFVTSSGETTPSTASNSVTAGLATVTPPNAAPTGVIAGGGGLGVGFYDWAYTFVTATGETTPSPILSLHSAGGQGALLSSIAVGPFGTTARKVYRTIAKVTFPNGGQLKLLTTLADNTTTGYTDTTADGSLGANVPTSNTATAAKNVVPLTAIPLGPAQVTSRKLYRRFNGSGTFKLVTTIANNTATTYSDTVANGSLGADAPSSNTSPLNHVGLSSIPIGPSGTTSRKIYRTVAAGSQLKLLTTIANNTGTTYSDSTADASLTTNVPTSDTSGLTQPTGQVVAGSTSLIVAGPGAFSSTGGWAVIGNGAQIIRYTGTNSTSLTGIPATGVGAITATVSYNSTITAMPHLSGIPSSSTGSILYAIVENEPANLLVQVDDTAAQATLASLIGGDGVQEDYLQDNRLSHTESLARATAQLTLRSAKELSVKYSCRDPLTQSGRTIHVNLTSPVTVSGDFKIQQVTIEFSASAQASNLPTYSVEASSTRFSFEDLLRVALVAA